MHGTLETKLSRHFNPKLIRNYKFSEFLLQTFLCFTTDWKIQNTGKTFTEFMIFSIMVATGARTLSKGKRKKNDAIINRLNRFEAEETTYCHLNIPISQCSLSRIAWPWKFPVSFPANIILFLLILFLVYSCGRSVIEWLSIIYLGLELNVDLSSFAPILARFRGRDLFPLSLRIQIISSVFVVRSSKLMLYIARLTYQKSIWRFIDLKIFWIP